jgi:hypothetical protein
MVARKKALIPKTIFIAVSLEIVFEDEDWRTSNDVLSAGMLASKIIDITISDNYLVVETS